MFCSSWIQHKEQFLISIFFTLLTERTIGIREFVWSICASYLLQDKICYYSKIITYPNSVVYFPMAFVMPWKNCRCKRNKKWMTIKLRGLWKVCCKCRYTRGDTSLRYVPASSFRGVKSLRASFPLLWRKLLAEFGPSNLSHEIKLLWIEETVPGDFDVAQSYGCPFAWTVQGTYRRDFHCPLVSVLRP